MISKNNVGAALKKMALAALGGLAIIAAILGFGTATATADKLECNLPTTVIDNGDGTYKCKGRPGEVYAFPTESAPSGAGQDIVRSLPKGVAGGGTSETKLSTVASPSVTSSPFNGGLGASGSNSPTDRMRSLFVPNGVLVPGFGRR